MSEHTPMNLEPLKRLQAAYLEFEAAYNPDEAAAAWNLFACWLSAYGELKRIERRIAGTPSAADLELEQFKAEAEAMRAKTEQTIKANREAREAADKVLRETLKK